MSTVRLLAKSSSYARSVFAWCRGDGFLVVGPTVLIVAGLLVLFLVPDDAMNPMARANSVGTVAELVGLISVAAGLRHLRQLHNKETALAALRSKLAKFPNWPRNRIVAVTATSKITLGDASVVATGSVGPSPRASLEERVKYLEGRLSSLTNEFHAEKTATAVEFRKTRELAAAEARARSDGLREVGVLLEQSVASGLVAEAVGLWFLMIGLALTNFSEQLAPYL